MPPCPIGCSGSRDGPLASRNFISFHGDFERKDVVHFRVDDHLIIQGKRVVAVMQQPLSEFLHSLG
jgi:hypothetical protein